MAPKVFISYRRDEAKWQARDIHRALCRTISSDQVFMDVDAIPLGANFPKILKDRVDECDVLLALIGPGWVDASDPKTKRRRLDNPSDFVRLEIGGALARGVPVVLVLLDGAPVPDVDSLPDDLKELVARQAEFVEYRTFEADIERLIRKLRLTSDEGTDEPPIRSMRRGASNNRIPIVIAAVFALASFGILYAHAYLHSLLTPEGMLTPADIRQLALTSMTTLILCGLVS